MRRAIVIALLPTFACVADSSDDDVIVPPLGGKADGFDDTAGIAFGDEGVEGTFDKDFQFWAYTFEARQDARVTIEVTDRGTTEFLDTTLFLYAMPEGEEPRRLMFDDDDGDGKLSKLVNVQLLEEGEYAAVLGTKGADGRGNFRLELRCESGECGPITEPPPPCPQPMREDMYECLQESSAEFDFEAGLNELITDFCGTLEEIAARREGLCDRDQAPSWCEDRDAIDACHAFGAESYPPPHRPAGLLVADASDPALEAVAQAAFDSDNCGDLGADAGCEFNAASFSHAPTETLIMPELLAHARTLTSPGPGVYPEQTIGTEAAAEFQAFVGAFDATEALQAWVDAQGLDLADAEFASADGQAFQFNHGDCEGAVLVAHFRAAGRVLMLDTLTCFG